MNELNKEMYFPDGVFDLIKAYAGIDPIKKHRECFDKMLRKIFDMTDKIGFYFEDGDCKCCVDTYKDMEYYIIRGINSSGYPEDGYDATY